MGAAHPDIRSPFQQNWTSTSAGAGGGGFLKEIAQEVYNNNNLSRKGEDDESQPTMGVDE
ncbi:hypothetical protein PGT21_007327 [Puccinia graminis f. sp. tritici]|uniref:Uncharacterized protein n=1 Tax=Puccinia graminis f. sp. tritici TaxID=56615 RepID=A0A5B0MCU8_PUCGR|nr:hypothetical protein PGT21_007327 [Puccinia graminis f. sp. tritici]